MKTKIIFIDLDGTLLGTNRKVSERNLAALHNAGDSGIIRVIATGRSLFSFRKVIANDFPIDYLIFSSGAGVMDWKSQEIIYEEHLTDEQTAFATDLLLEEEADFMIQAAIPDNHYFLYYGKGDGNPDFHSRIAVYEKYAELLKLPWKAERSSQLLAVLPKGKEGDYEMLKAKLPDLKVIRATSPLDGESAWIEIFPAHVSKGHTAQWLCDYLKLDQNSSLAIGNDYNDYDMLEWAENSYVVQNAPQELLDEYEIVPANDDDGVAVVLESYNTLAMSP